MEERGRVKCHQYWPSEGGEAYGDIQVTLTQTVELSDFTIRTFCLKKANSRSERILNQYHYTIWPDHGVPTCATSVLTFVRKASGANPPDAGPMVSYPQITSNTECGERKFSPRVLLESVLTPLSVRKFDVRSPQF